MSALQLLPGQGPRFNHKGHRAVQQVYGSQSDTGASNFGYRCEEIPQWHQSRDARGSDQMCGAVSAQRPSSRGHYQSWDSKPVHIQTPPHRDPSTLSSSWSSQKVRPPSRRSSKSSSVRGSQTGSHRPEQEPLDPKVAMIGSWCNDQARYTVASAELFAVENDVLVSNDWYPRTPRKSGLSTPELGPMSMDYEFCACCKNEEDRINETWYMTSKVKMEDQCMSRALDLWSLWTFARF
ncbi:hypothetical protein AK830_g1912 [Neonectria ditissima]|uniref:Uncharacterized protein n=1 Tax=Neonectria ditissima TaxID=78410 RepID=A0A0P7BT68_9HYPO|nr:hypothetical protein AK830_g1912 [Neonectria ditissima]